MQAFLYLAIVCLVLAFCSAATINEDIIASFSVPSEALFPAALYWTGHDDISERLSEERPWLGNSDTENLIDVIHPGSELMENIVPGSSFVIRSSDFSSRVRVSFKMNPDATEAIDRPFTLRFVNLAMEDRSGPFPVELKHSNAGYIWIDPMEYVEHITHINHEFEIRDRNHEPVFIVSIRGTNKNEL